MKSKNLVSLSVAAVFLVLSITGLLIYFGQGNHVVDHLHAWFGVLFFGAAVFHIVNNWASLVGYSRERRTGGIRRELIIPAVVVALFVLGVSLDWPVFKDLGNAGKTLVRGERKRPAPLAGAAADSVARVLEAQYSRAWTTGDTALLARSVGPNVALVTDSGQLMSMADIRANFQAKPQTYRPERVLSLDENLLMVYGTRLLTGETAQAHRFAHLFKKDRDDWKLISSQILYEPGVVASK